LSVGVWGNLSESVTLERIYEELVALNEKLSLLEWIILPPEEVSPDELAEIRELEREASEERVPWFEVKGRVEELLRE
jgi:hypothetical protein